MINYCEKKIIIIVIDFTLLSWGGLKIRTNSEKKTFFGLRLKGYVFTFHFLVIL